MHKIPLNSVDKNLIEAAQEILSKRYHPERHTAASAVLCKTNKIYTGINIEACAYGPCAEPIAIGNAFTSGDWHIKSIVTVAKRGDDNYFVLSPCGNCRQLLVDYCPDAMVIVNENGNIYSTKASSLLPAAYKINI